MVYNSYLKVTAKDSSAGVDGETVKVFNEDLKGNLCRCGCFSALAVPPLQVFSALAVVVYFRNIGTGHDQQR